MEEVQENQENQEINQQQVEETPKQPEVGFPLSQSKPQGKMNKWPFIVLGILILIGALIFIFSRGSKEESLATPTPETELTVVSTPTPLASLSPADREAIKIEIQNGTGISGEAAYLQGQLRSLGYTNIKVGNSESQNNTITVVTFADSLNSQIVSEITDKLEGLYQDVQTKTSSTGSVDILILTGLKKGATSRPSATPTPTTSASPTASATPTATPQ